MCFGPPSEKWPKCGKCLTMRKKMRRSSARNPEPSCNPTTLNVGLASLQLHSFSLLNRPDLFAQASGCKFLNLVWTYVVVWSKWTWEIVLPRFDSTWFKFHLNELSRLKHVILKESQPCQLGWLASLRFLTQPSNRAPLAGKAEAKKMMINEVRMGFWGSSFVKK